MDADLPDDEHDKLARAIDLYGDGQAHREAHASNDAAAVAAYYRVLIEHMSEDAAVHLTCEWMRLGHEAIEWSIEDEPGGDA